jgi:glutathione peroxidase
MKITLFAMFIFSLFHVPKAQSQNSIHSLSVTSIDGKAIPLSNFKGKKLMIVNTASECGFTPQYKDLEKLYQNYKDKGFEILAIPSNDFKNQEKGSNSDIKAFCERNYGVTFMLAEKTNVRNTPIHPIYEWLTKKELNGVKNNNVKWNFHKFMIDEEGRLIDDLNPWRSPNCYKIRKWLKG